MILKNVSTKQRLKNFWVQIVKIEVNGAFKWTSITYISEIFSLKLVKRKHPNLSIFLNIISEEKYQIQRKKTEKSHS